MSKMLHSWTILHLHITFLLVLGQNGDLKNLVKRIRVFIIIIIIIIIFSHSETKQCSIKVGGAFAHLSPTFKRKKGKISHFVFCHLNVPSTPNLPAPQKHPNQHTHTLTPPHTPTTWCCHLQSRSPSS